MGGDWDLGALGPRDLGIQLLRSSGRCAAYAFATLGQSLRDSVRCANYAFVSLGRFALPILRTSLDRSLTG